MEGFGQTSAPADSGSKLVKPAIFGGLALLFAGGIFAMVHTRTPATPMNSAAAAPTTQTASTDGSAPAAASGDSNATANVADPTAVASAAAAPAPADANAPSGDRTAIASSAPATPAAGDSAAMSTAAAAPAATPAASAAAGNQVAMTDTSSSSSSSDAAPAPEKKSARANREPVRPEPAAAADVLRPWWQPATDNRFAVQFVGQAADQQTLVIRFSRQVSDPAASENIKLLAENGQPVVANFQPGQDPRVLIVPNLEPGRYTVMIDPKLTSTNNETLGTELHGPAFIQQTTPATAQAFSPANTTIASAY